MKGRRHRCRNPEACAVCLMRRNVNRALAAVVASTLLPHRPLIQVTVNLPPAPVQGEPHVCGAGCPRPCPARRTPWGRP